MAERKKQLLLVDDDAMNLDVLAELLGEEFSIRTADCGDSALVAVSGTSLPDMILLDVDMPGMDGYTVCQALKHDPKTSAIPVIFLTSHHTTAAITQAFKVGAVDFIAKPVIPEVLLARVRTHLRLTEVRCLLEDQNRHLESLVQERTQALQKRNEDLVRVQELSIIALGSLAETRDTETGNHIYRTQEYVRAMVEQMQCRPHLRAQMGDDGGVMIWRSAPLHDIGKVGIPDEILLKPGKLNETEFAVMKRHTVLGRDALQSAERRARFDDSFLRTAAEIAYSHHEHWNGSGYPEGLAGRSIPFSARLMAVADVYDALISRRVYKSAFPHATALDLIRAGRGGQFDPDVVDCFIEMESRIIEIAELFKDHA
jgi:putative two-component system response regulator